MRSIRGAGVAALAGLLLQQAAAAQAPASFDAAFDAIRTRPEFAHSQFGVEVYAIDRKQVLYAWNPQTIFQTGSTAKVLTEATSLELLGPDFRFHTPVYRTGPVANGALDGNLVLVASGDPNLSNRLQPDGTLAYSDKDHSYGGFDARLLPGDPAAALDALARQIAAAGIRTIRGHILIDASLFPEGDKEMGTHVTRSPVAVNDNVVDLRIAPGQDGGPATLKASPDVSYLHFVNKVVTGAKGSGVALDQDEIVRPDGGVDVIVTGHLPVDRGAYVYPYAVASPSRFAAALLTAALARHGVTVAASPAGPAPVPTAFKAAYTPANKVAEWVSAPLREDVKVTLQTSQNLHASMMPLVWGGTLGKPGAHAEMSGFALENKFLTATGVDFSGIVQSNGEGGALFSPDFVAHFLAYMTTRPSFAVFHAALPVLGRSGTLRDLMPDSPAAGHVFAKTGTIVEANLLGDGLIVSAKALAGYTTTPSGEQVAIAIYLNNVPVAASLSDPAAASAAVARVTGSTLAEIAAAIHMLPIAPAR